MASSSSMKHDVFLSFRGEDTRRGFTSHLYAALRRKGIDTFLDDEEIKRGYEISPSLLAAIEGSKISIIIFSENYASSTWCLKELAKIIECKRKMQHVVLPVFYNIDPSDVRRQSGTYADAFVKHEEYSQDMVQEWRRALEEVANSAGWDSSNTRLESELVENIVNDVLEKLNRTSNPQVPHGLVGIKEDIIHIESLLCIESKGVRIIGIWGMGGAGKTTIADFLFKKLSSQFQHCAFVENVREKWTYLGRDELRNQLFRQILEEPTLSIRTSSIRSTNIVNRLQRTKVLIVLDDVSDFQHMNYLVEEKDWFGSGSKIIVTTRNKDVLPKENVGLHEVKALNNDEALQLFCLKAFPKDSPKNEFKDLCKMVLDYAQGNPLAITILGSLLCFKNQEEWKGTLQKMKEVPDPKIHNVLRMSYEELDEQEKEIFLDIACCLKGEKKGKIIDLVDGRNSSISIGLKNLQDKSLITISKTEVVEMHGLIQEMGQHIVREESMKHPEERSRLWDPEDIYYVLKCNTVNHHSIESISLNMSQIKEVQISPDVFTRMPRLRLLKFYMPNNPYLSNSLEYPHKCNVIIPKDLEWQLNHLRYLRWDHFPMKTLPLSFRAEILVEIHLEHSPIKKLCNGDQDFVSLKILRLVGCYNLLELPCLNKAANLEEIDIFYCRSLKKLWDRDQDVVNLKKLQLVDCHSLLELPCLNKAANLEKISISSCRSLKKFWDGDRDVVSLKILWLKDCDDLLELQCLNKAMNLESISIFSCKSLNKLWDGDHDVVNLKILRLESCDNLLELQCLNKAANLERIGIFSCRSLNKLWDADQDVVNLKELRLIRCHNLLELPCLNKAANLEKVNISSCRNLKKLWDEDQDVVNLKKLRLVGCHNLHELPCLKKVANLVEINISYCRNLKKLWDGDQDVVNLKKLRLEYCDNLLELPCLNKATRLEEINILSCRSLLHVPSHILSLDSLLAVKLVMCTQLRCLRSDKPSKSLRKLSLFGCSNLTELSVASENLRVLCLGRTPIEELLFSVGQLTTSFHLGLNECQRLKKFSPIPDTLRSIKVLSLRHSELSELSENLSHLSTLKRLYLSGSDIKTLPSSVKLLRHLELLDVSDCKRLRSLLELPPSLHILYASGCISLETMASITPRALMKNCLHLQKSLLPMQNKKPRGLLDSDIFVEQFDFTNCTKLDENACKTILDEATIRIKYAAYVSSMEEVSIHPYHQLYICSEASNPELFHYTYHLFLFKYVADRYLDSTRIEKETSNAFAANFNGISGGDLRRLVLALELNKEKNTDVDFDTSMQRICMQQGFPIPIFTFVTGRWCMCVKVKLPGSRVPRWIRYRTTETPFIITIQLPPSSHLLDFACCFILKKGVFLRGDDIKCECSMEDAEGNRISESFNFPLNPMTLISDIVYLCYRGRTFTRILKKLKEIRTIDQYSSFNPKLLFQFSCISSFGQSNDGLKECGVWPIYTSDLEFDNSIESNLEFDNPIESVELRVQPH